MVYWLSKDIILLCPVTSTLPARERDLGQANLPKWHSVNCFVCPFFLPGCGLQERLKSQMHGHFVWGGWQKRKTKFTLIWKRLD